MDQYFNTTGGPEVCFLEDGWGNESNWFSVAKIKGTEYYISVQERLNWVTQETATILRVSDDPGDWTRSNQVIIERSPGLWGYSSFTYPTFVDPAATTNYEISPAGFFLTGNQPSNGYALHARKYALQTQ